LTACFRKPAQDAEAGRAGLYSLRAHLLALALILSWLAAAPAQAARLLLTDACVQGAQVSECRAIEPALPFHWDVSGPVGDGQARFGFSFPRDPADGDTPTLFLPHAGNGFSVVLNNRLLFMVGTGSDQTVDAGKRPWLVPLPPTYLTAENRLVVTLHAVDGRAAQLQAPRIGSYASMQALYDREHQWRVETTRTLMWIAALIGVICLLMWMVQHDVLFAACGMAQLAWATRLAEMFWVQMPLGWPVWSALLATVFAGTQAALCYFFLLAAERWDARWRKGFLGATLAWAVVVPMIVWSASATAWLVWLALTTAGFIAVMLFVTWTAFREQQFWRWLLAAWVVASLGAGAADALTSPGSVYLHPTWSRFAVALFSLALVALVARQLREAFDADRARARELKTALTKQQQRLQALHEEEARREVERATWSERQRLMRDMHDGLGAQLYGLHALAGRPEAARRELQGQIRQAIEELRLVVDAMNPFDGDLAAMLGDLRPPLERRLALSQVELRWAVDELPTIPDFSPAKVQHLKRLLLEAATNIARHSGATEARLSASCHAGVLSLEIGDNGRGFDPNSPKAGNGLRNMRWRAMMIGAQFAIESKDGCRLRLKMPLTALQASTPSPGSLTAPAAATTPPTT
jgi:signal transduction histidine kinase